MVAFICLIAQVALFALPGEPLWVKCVVVIAAAYATLPLLALAPQNLFTMRPSGSETQTTEEKSERKLSGTLEPDVVQGSPNASIV